MWELEMTAPQETVDPTTDITLKHRAFLIDGDINFTNTTTKLFFSTLAVETINNTPERSAIHNVEVSICNILPHFFWTFLCV